MLVVVTSPYGPDSECREDSETVLGAVPDTALVQTTLETRGLDTILHTKVTLIVLVTSAVGVAMIGATSGGTAGMK